MYLCARFFPPRPPRFFSLTRASPTQTPSPKKKKTATAPPVAKSDSTEAVRPKQRANRWAIPDTTGSWQQKPIVVLVGRQTYSAANFTAAFLSILPHVTLIGDRTGGGGGLPVSFELPNGWKFRLSATRTYLPDGTDIENGIEPDIYQATGYEEAMEGKDAILERALAFFGEE
ncbi:MAG: S41 family peptidase [Bacteroidota bacterium]